MDKVCIVGLGYVGSALYFAMKEHGIEVSGWDIDVKKQMKLGCYSYLEDIDASMWVICVPTPVKDGMPDLSCFISAVKRIEPFVKDGDIVVSECTYAPGTTRRIVKDIIKKDIMLGYSPERINVGDFTHGLEDVVKVVAGDIKGALQRLHAIYGKITSVYDAESIEVAEMAKLLENTQRDVNIALINEFAEWCRSIDLDIYDVINTASTKWNFMRVLPGLVGGHCIAVDPYYAIAKASDTGVYLDVARTARNVNESQADKMGDMIAELMEDEDKQYHCLVLGFAFKGGTDDMRNTKVYDLVKYFDDMDSRGHRKVKTYVHDIMIDVNKARKEYDDLTFLDKMPDKHKYDIIILAVDHNKWLNNWLDDGTIERLANKNCIIADLCNITREYNFNLGARVVKW